MRTEPLVAGLSVLLLGAAAGPAAAATPERASDPFVCPVLTISQQAAEHSDRFNSLGNGQYTFGPGNAGSADTFNGNVPSHATNADGSGSPRRRARRARRRGILGDLERELAVARGDGRPGGGRRRLDASWVAAADRPLDGCVGGRSAGHAAMAASTVSHRCRSS